MKKLLIMAIAISCLIGQTSFGQCNISGDWTSFKPPVIKFTDKDNNTTVGAKIYNRLVTDKTAYISPVCEDIGRHIYFNGTQPLKVDQLQYTISYYDGVSAKSGSPPNISIDFSTKHVETTWNQTQSDIAVEAEIYGILFHEMTHGYQLEPKNAGAYDGKSEFWAKIEGEADAVRIRAGYHQNRTPNAGSKKWLEGYTTTGFFYNWIANNYDVDFMKKLNLSCKTIDPWTFDKAVKQILNKDASTLWNEYVAVINKGSKPVVKFNADRTLIGKGQSVNFTNSSLDALCYDWTFEGGTPRKSYDKNPTIRYDKEGVYKVTLVAHNKNAIGPGIEVKLKYITVGSATGTNNVSASQNEIKIGPNPFDERTNIEFNLQQAGSVSLVIYNQLGEQVKQLVNQNLNSGWHQYSWPAENDNGNKMPAGQYIYILRTKDDLFTGKLIILKQP
jgi:hypothetical protein